MEFHRQSSSLSASDGGQRRPARKRREHLRTLPYLYIAPFLVAFVLFFILPALYSLYLSFFSYRGFGVMKFVGFANFKSLLLYTGFWKSVYNTFFYFLAHLIPVMAGGFLAAVGLSSKLAQGVRKIYKPLFFLPQIVPVIATALIFQIMFSTNSGAINQLFGWKTPWLENAVSFRWVVVVLVVWRSFGWFMVIFLSGLTTINADLYEAASIDGANGFQQMVRITLPLMRPFFLFSFIMDAISSFKIYTEPNLLSASQKASIDTAPMMNMVTNNLKSGNFGVASASGWLLFVLILVVSLVELYLLRNKE